MFNEIPDWANTASEDNIDTSDASIQHAEPITPEVISAEDKQPWRVRKPKRGSDPSNPEVYMQILSHSTTHGKDTLQEVNQVVKDISISGNILKKLQAPCPYFPQEKGKEAITNSEAVADVLLQKAISGDLASIREVLNRSEGKVPNVTHNESKSLKVSTTTDGLAALFQQLDSNKQ